MNNQEKWKIELQRQQRAKIRSRTIPIDQQKQMLTDNMAVYKRRLSATLATNATEKIRPLLERLIELRGEQTALALLAYRQQHNGLNEAIVKSAIQSYYTDCYALGVLADQS